MPTNINRQSGSDDEPAASYLRRCQIRAWLEPLGISIKQIDKLRDAGVIRVVKLGGVKSHGYFLKTEIITHVIIPLTR